MVAESALAVVLVVGAGLMLRSFASLQQVEPGFRPSGLLTFRLFLPAETYPDGARRSAFFSQLHDRLRAVPGVTNVTAMSGLPPRRRMNANTLRFEGIEQTPDGPLHIVDFYQYVTED